MWRIFSAVFDSIVPPHGDVVLSRTLSPEDIRALLSPQRASGEWIVALFPYRDPRIRALIRALKYRDEKRLLGVVGTFLGEYVLELLSEKRALSGWNDVRIVPMPTSGTRLRTRGYNQAERIAEAALPTVGSAAAFAPLALSREERKSQVSVERKNRYDNVRGAFSANAKIVQGKCILLIDDVVESGGTMEDARRALLSAGAKDVFGIALAH